MARVSPDELSPAGLKFSHTKEIDLGHAPVRAARMAHAGGPGCKLYVPVEMTRHVDLTLMQAGADLGVRDAGYHVLDALRIEAGRRDCGACRCRPPPGTAGLQLRHDGEGLPTT